MSSNRKLHPERRRRAGDVFPHPRTGKMVRIDESGREQPFVPTPGPYDCVHEGRDPTPEELYAFIHAHDPPAPGSSLPEQIPPRRADGSISPFYKLTQDQLAALQQDVPQGRRVRHDGWTIERQRDFVERLAGTASFTDAARFVGKSRQSARDLYNRSPAFRAACDEALRISVGVLAETAFDRAVNGVQEQVWYKGRMVGFREKYNDRLLMFLLRVRDPLNFAPLDDLQGWQRHRAVEDESAGISPTLDRLEAAENAWAAGQQNPAIPSPADLLERSSHATSSTSSPAAAAASEDEEERRLAAPGQGEAP